MHFKGKPISLTNRSQIAYNPHRQSYAKSPSRKHAALEDAIATASVRSAITSSPTKKATARAGRIMYIECKAGGLTGPARIGRVTFSQTGRTLYYRGQKFQSLKGAGFKSNYYDVETSEDYWISGPKRTVWRQLSNRNR